MFLCNLYCEKDEFSYKVAFNHGNSTNTLQTETKHTHENGNMYFKFKYPDYPIMNNAICRIFWCITHGTNKHTSNQKLYLVKCKLFMCKTYFTSFAKNNLWLEIRSL